MDYVIKQIVEDVFKEVKKNCPSDAHTTLSNYIEAHSNPRISYKTAARAYKKYIDEEETDWSLRGDSIKNFCEFLGYEDYKDYVEQNIRIEKTKDEKKPDNTETRTTNLKEEEEEGRKKRKWILTLKITIAFGLAVILYQSVSKLMKLRNDNMQPNVSYKSKECMAWAKDHYEITDCGFQLHPDYRTIVEPYLLSKSKMKKIEVDASTTFFSEETEKPLVWYYKTKEGTLEYFNAPGLHPISGETLKKITEGMIEKYVPIHKTQPDSFISNDSENSIKAGMAILVLNNNEFDDNITSSLKTRYFNKNNSVIRLKDSIIYQKSFISNFNLDKKLYLKGKPILVDTLVLGSSRYNFSNDIEIQNMVICNLSLHFSIYTLSDNKWEETLSKMINSTGSGYTKTEAKTNALKKINYE